MVKTHIVTKATRVAAPPTDEDDILFLIYFIPEKKLFAVRTLCMCHLVISQVCNIFEYYSIMSLSLLLIRIVFAIVTFYNQEMLLLLIMTETISIIFKFLKF
jgi:hypothetical protein